MRMVLIKMELVRIIITMITNRVKKAVGSNENGTNKNGIGSDYYHDDYKSNHINTLTATSKHKMSTSTSYYGKKTLGNTKQIFGDEHFNLLEHINELFSKSSTNDVQFSLQDLSG
eukprot:364749_1